MVASLLYFSTVRGTACAAGPGTVRGGAPSMVADTRSGVGSVVGIASPRARSDRLKRRDRPLRACDERAAANGIPLVCCARRARLKDKNEGGSTSCRYHAHMVQAVACIFHFSKTED